MQVPLESLLGTIFVGVLIAVAVVLARGKAVRVNLARRRKGLRPIKARDLRRYPLTVAELVAATDETLAEQRTLWRQKEWEKHLYHQELSSRGYAVRRAYCAEHDRYCYSAGGPHPPGGTQIDPVPDDFDPDGAPLANVEREQRERDARS